MRKSNKSNGRMMKGTIVIVLLLLAFGKDLLAMLCRCKDETPETGKIDLPEDNEISATTQSVDVELYEREHDENVLLASEPDLIKEFFPGTQTLEITNFSYA